MNCIAKKMARLGVFAAILFCSILKQQVYALEESTGPGGSNAKALHELSDVGQGVNIGVILARNVRATHEAFADGNGVSHAFNFDFSGDGISISSHDTQLAGIISSRGGAAYPNDIGVAPGADIYCARLADNTNGISWTNFNNALADFIINRGCRVFVTGFELTGLTPDGQSDWTLMYDYYAYQYGAIFVNPAGNENTYVAIFGDAYNGITTGGLRLNDINDQNNYRMAGSISGSGPTSDGRRKPDITAPAQNQTVPTSSSDTAWATVGTAYGETSYSVPQMAGAIALMLTLADQTASPNDNDSEVIKAVLVNSAMPNINSKTGAFTNPADSNNTWQKDRGYGRLDCLRAYQTLDTNEVEPGVYISQEKGWGYGSLARNQTASYTINVGARSRLIATLSWQRRIQWTDGFPKNQTIDPGELTGFLADLDMEVYAPGVPISIFDKAAFGFDASDNLIKCDLLILNPGDYTIVISNNSIANETANYGFAFEVHPIMTGDLPTINYTVNYNDLSDLANEWLATGSSLDALLMPNGIIDFGDFSKLANYWLQTDPWYYHF